MKEPIDLLEIAHRMLLQTDWNTDPILEEMYHVVKGHKEKRYSKVEESGTIVKFFPGDGEEVFIEVEYIADYPRDKQSRCAFCHGDPCGQNRTSKSSEMIRQYYKRSAWMKFGPVTCPLCEGRPS